VTSSEQRRYFVEPTRFNTLRRGGAANDFNVECIIYNGGMQFSGVDGDAHPALLPHLFMNFKQR
jgi:hypothetical protein